MKKILMLCSVLAVSGCITIGPIKALKGGSSWVDRFTSMPVEYKDNTPRLVKSQQLNENSFNKNEIRTAFKGYSVLSSKMFQRDYYTSEKMRAVGKQILGSASEPFEIQNGETMPIVGYVTMDGIKYSLLQTNELDGFVFLVNSKNGKLYDKIGHLKDDRLRILEQEYYFYNPDFRFETVFNTVTEQSKPIKGFDLKYDGLRMNRMWFVFYDYASGKSGGFREYDFPNKPGLLTIRDIKLRVLAADDQRLDYMILAD